MNLEQMARLVSQVQLLAMACSTKRILMADSDLVLGKKAQEMLDIG
jgi:hypothetical protein